MEGVAAHLLAGREGQAVFFELPAGVTVPLHSHGAQWGIIVAGSIELTIAGQTSVYAQGDTYFIGQGVEHAAVTKEPCWAIDVFADPDRYRIK
jgi:quercetin dioxygenase-like cupin family protein